MFEILFDIAIPSLLVVFCALYAIKEFKLIKNDTSKPKTRFITLCVCACIMAIYVLVSVFMR